MSNRAIAKELSVHEKTIRTLFKKIGYRRDRLVSSPKVELEVPLELWGDAVIAADFHIPLHDERWINKMLDVSQQLGIKNCIIAGDFYNFDSLSHYDPKQPEARLDVECQVAREVMNVLLDVYDDVYFIWGNHDYRLVKYLGYKHSFVEALGVILDDDPHLHVSNLDHMWLMSGYEFFYVCHPATYSQIPLSSALKLANKHDSNIITAHSHHFATGYAKNGEYVIAEAGGLFNASKTAYLQRSTNYPRWQNGFLIVRDGIILPYSEKICVPSQ